MPCRCVKFYDDSRSLKSDAAAFAESFQSQQKAVDNVGGCLQPSTLSTKIKCGKSRATACRLATLSTFGEEHMTKQDFRDYRNLQKEIRQLQDLIREADSRVYSPGQTRITGQPGAVHAATQGSVQERIATELFELRTSYDRAMIDLIKRSREIERVIEQLEDSTERQIMRLKYLRGYSWKRVCREIGYEWTQTHTIHRRALEHASKIEP